MTQLTIEEASKLQQKHGLDWMCPVCTSSMVVVSKLIRHPTATKESFPCIVRCILCNHEEIVQTKVENEYIVRVEK